MKSLSLALVLFLSGAAFAADSKGEIIYYEFKDTGSLLVKGNVAEKMYADLDVRPTREIIDVDIFAMRKQGKNVTCYSRTDTQEVQCVISVSDRRAGTID